MQSDKEKTNWLLLALEDWTTWADRWDIVEGHYWFYVDWHGGQGSYFYQRLCRIRSYYKPSRYPRGTAICARLARLSMMNWSPGTLASYSGRGGPGMTFITLEIDAETGEAETWVAHSRSSFTARVNRRLREMVEAGSLAVGGHYKDPLEGLEALSEAGLEIMVFDQLHAIAHVRSKGAHHWALYEALRDHGLIHPPFIVSWYDCRPR